MNEDEIYQKGFEYRCNGQYAEARAEFQRVLGMNPSHIKARMQIGDVVLLPAALGEVEVRPAEPMRVLECGLGE